MSASTGILWIDLLCKPVVKHLLHHPLFVLSFVCLVYACVSYEVVKTAYLADEGH